MRWTFSICRKRCRSEILSALREPRKLQSSWLVGKKLFLKMAQRSPELLTSLLKEVSRSFYLTMRILPSAIRSQISLAYLLARTTDTIADTEIIPVERRLEALERLRARIL